MKVITSILLQDYFWAESTTKYLGILHVNFLVCIHFTHFILTILAFCRWQWLHSANVKVFIHMKHFLTYRGVIKKKFCVNNKAMLKVTKLFVGGVYRSWVNWKNLKIVCGYLSTTHSRVVLMAIITFHVLCSFLLLTTVTQPTTCSLVCMENY